MLCRRLEAEAADRTTGYLDGLRKVRQKRSRHDMLSPHLRAAGHDISEPGRLEEAWDELSGYLPRRVRKAGLEALIAAEVDGLRHDHLSQSSSSEKMPSRTKAVEWFFWERDAEAIARTRLDEPEPELIQDERLEAVEDEWIPF